MNRIYQIFLKGLFTLLPISLTIGLVVWVGGLVQGIFAEPLQAAFPSLLGFPGAGFIVALIFVFSVGLLVNSYLTRQLVNWLEAKLERLPIFRAIYNPIRDVTKLFNHNDRSTTQRVVMVKIGETGIETMGLVTRDNFEDLPKDFVPDDSVAVFFPLSYGMGGMTIMVPRKSLRETSLPAERAMQLAITGWIKTLK